MLFRREGAHRVRSAKRAVPGRADREKSARAERAREASPKGAPPRPDPEESPGELEQVGPVLVEEEEEKGEEEEEQQREEGIERVQEEEEDGAVGGAEADVAVLDERAATTPDERQPAGGTGAKAAGKDGEWGAWGNRLGSVDSGSGTVTLSDTVAPPGPGRTRRPSGTASAGTPKRLQALLAAQSSLPRRFRYPRRLYHNRLNYLFVATWPVALLMLFLRMTDALSLWLLVPFIGILASIGVAAYGYAVLPISTAHELAPSGMRLRVGKTLDLEIRYEDIESVRRAASATTRMGIWLEEGRLWVVTDRREAVEVVLRPDRTASWNGRSVERAVLSVEQPDEFIRTAQDAIDLARLRLSLTADGTAGRPGRGGGRAPRSGARARPQRT